MRYLINVVLQLFASFSKEIVLVGVGLGERVDFLHALGSELNLAGKEIDTSILVQWRFNEGRFGEASLTGTSPQESVGHTGTSIGHRQSSRSRTLLGIDNFVTTELDSLCESITGLTHDLGVFLREKRDNGMARVTASNGDIVVGWVRALELGDEAGGTNDVEGGHTEETLGVVNTPGLENLRYDGHGAVDRVGDNQQVGPRGVLSSSLSQITDNRGIGVEKI